MSQFRFNLQGLRRARQLTQEQLARLLKVQPRLVSRWETGEAKPHFDYMIRLAEVLEVSLDELARAADEVAEPPSFEIQNRRLKELCRQVDGLSREDQDVVCYLMDSVIRNERRRDPASKSVASLK